MLKRLPRNQKRPSKRKPEVVPEIKPEVAPEIKPESVDMAKVYPATLEEFNRSAVHVMDKANAAFKRAKDQNPTDDCLSKLRAVIHQFQDIMLEIDKIAIERRV